VLITGLIFMVILTLIVLALLRSGTLEERMAANARNRLLALQAAEAVLRDAEESLPSGPVALSADCTNGYCTKLDDPAKRKERLDKLDWSEAAGKSRTFAKDASYIGSTLVASQPRYIIELASTPVCVGGYPSKIRWRITARGVGQDFSEVFVQSLYSTRPAKCL
jgi:type IV pilus assembly protein PilX